MELLWVASHKYGASIQFFEIENMQYLEKEIFI